MQISKIILTNFRNFTSKKFEFSKPLTLLVGPNGVGKTNILEALTLLGRNSSLRGSDFESLIKVDGEEKKFSIFAEISDHEFVEKIALSFNLADKKKIFYINNEPYNAKRQGDLKNSLINFVYLTPSIEQLFILGKSERRNYLDKIVSDIDIAHNSRVTDYQKLLKERLIILQKYRGGSGGDKWLNIVENNIVELGVAIASARVEAISFFNKAITSFASNFPKTELKIIGEIENKVNQESAVRIEEYYKERLENGRLQDLESFKTDFGVHRSDFDAIFLNKNISAILSSTGEQKAIMLSITLARARISASYKNQPTILIFDEVASHLDEGRKKNLFEEIRQAGLQAFFSATSKDLVPQDGSIDVVEI